MPGTQLKDEPDLYTRLDEFCQLYQGLHKPPADDTEYHTYMDWVNNIAAYMRTRTDFPEMTEKMTRAEEICRQLWEKYRRRLLLHGDLHHENILKGESGYRIIDPKGVVGDPVFDIPRFMLNEDDLYSDDDFAKAVRILEDKLGVPAQDLRQLFYVEMCMGNCWGVEGDGNVSGMDSVLFAERMLDIDFVADDKRRGNGI